MLFVLSPAKSLDYDAPLADQPHTAPLFVKQSKLLIDQLRAYSPQGISQLMSLSDALSTLNVARYQAWSSRATPQNARQAALAFDGDVYGGLDAKTLGTDDLQWAQDHVCILSGLYGVLRPLDLMQPYRLEMGTALPTAQGQGLYRFWAEHISNYLNTRLRHDISPVVVNLASQEYFKAVSRPKLKAAVVECVFEEYKAPAGTTTMTKAPTLQGSYKVISFFAKRARGLMARYAITHQLTTPDQLRAFDLEGYRYTAKASTPERLVFRRKA